jgi:hydroxymethylbilane synthase
MKRRLTIATRSSRLALWQTHWVREGIAAHHPDVEIDLIELTTQGDRILDTPLAAIGGKGLFVKELETAILERKADIAVHSLKDVPTELPDGLEISVMTRRGTPSDAFVSNRYPALDTMPSGAVVGTSSLRRVAQLRHWYPHLVFESLRGNVNTRLRKLDDGAYDAIILAAAGLQRLGMADRITAVIDHTVSLPAIGQGAICIESRIGDCAVMEMIGRLAHEETTLTVAAERALLKRLNGGCQVPLAGHAVLDRGIITLTGLIAGLDGSHFLRLSEIGPADTAPAIGERLGTRLIAAGGGEILAAAGIEVI